MSLPYSLKAEKTATWFAMGLSTLSGTYLGIIQLSFAHGAGGTVPCQ